MKTVFTVAVILFSLILLGFLVTATWALMAGAYTLYFASLFGVFISGSIIAHTLWARSNW